MEKGGHEGSRVVTKQMRSFSSPDYYDAGLRASVATFAVNESAVKKSIKDAKNSTLGVLMSR